MANITQKRSKKQGILLLHVLNFIENCTPTQARTIVLASNNRCNTKTERSTQ